MGEHYIYLVFSSSAVKWPTSVALIWKTCVNPKIVLELTYKAMIDEPKMREGRSRPLRLQEVDPRHNHVDVLFWHSLLSHPGQNVGYVPLETLIIAIHEFLLHRKSYKSDMQRSGNLSRMGPRRVELRIFTLST